MRTIKRNISQKDINHKLRQLLQETLMLARETPAAKRDRFVRNSLKYIQIYCQRVSQPFAFHELEIACNQYGLGGSLHHSATLFHGPNEEVSVAICVTKKGSLLHRNDGPWQVYYSAGDVSPAQGKINETVSEIAKATALEEIAIEESTIVTLLSAA